VGASFYRDEIPASRRSHPVAHQIVRCLCGLSHAATEVMAEWLQLSYRQDGGIRYDNRGGYVQASSAFGKLRPYYRYDRLGIILKPPLIGGFGSSDVHLLGMPLDPPNGSGLKAQYERHRENHGRGSTALHVQLVFVF
jgi:hypothetical protein